MPPIRKFLLEAVALTGGLVGISVAIGSYISNMPHPPERVAVASAWADPETTGSITRAEAADSPASGTSIGADRTGASEGDAAEPKGTWTDPPRHRKPR